MIKVENLQKNYGSIAAVKNISFEVSKGELFAFLGPNGAGKSTTIDILCTFLKPDGGKVYIDGFELGKEDEKIRQSLGVVFQKGLLDEALSIEKNLYYRGALYGLQGKPLQNKVAEVISLTGIASYAKRPYEKLSGGQRRRCDIARSLLSQPKLLFLDEPTTGLDPQSREDFWRLFTRLQQERKITLFVTTHYMEEAEQADHVVVVDEGRIVAKGTPSELKNVYGKDRVLLIPKDEEAVTTLLKQQNINYKKAKNGLILEYDDTLSSLPLINSLSPYLAAFEVKTASMDEVFLNITGKELDR